MTFGERIKKARKSEGWTQERLAKEVDSAVITIRQYELGSRQPKIEQLQAISAALEVPINYFLYGIITPTIGEIMQAQMRKLRISVSELAKRTGISKERILQILDNPYLLVTCEERNQIENALNIRTDQLPFASDLISVDLGLLALNIKKKYNIPVEYASSIVDDALEAFLGELNTPEGAQIERSLLKLNKKGKQVAIEQVKELTKIREYTTDDPEPGGKEE